MIRFIESDGYFYVRKNKNYWLKHKKLQRIIVCEISKISEFLSTTINFQDKYSQYWVKTCYSASNKKLVSYMLNYPLFVSKHLDYLVSPSPWPIFVSINLLTTTGVLSMHGFSNAPIY